MTNTLMILGVVVAVVLSGLALLSGGSSTVPVGGTYNANTEFTNPIVFSEGITEGGDVLTVSEDDGTVTLTEAQLQNNRVVKFTGGAAAAALTVTLPATSTMDTLLPNSGDTKTWIFENAYTAAATTTTIAAGTGIDLQEPDGQNVVVGINNYGWLTCFREASTNVVCRVDETIPAD